MFKKTLGGDRLGSGKKMLVDLQGYDRSNQDLSFVMRTTASPGTLVPFLCKVALPGDTWDIDLAAEIMTLPTIGPLFGSFKVQLDVFEVPIRLYNSYLHNNKIGIGLSMDKVKLPQIELTAPGATGQPDDLDNCQINPSCLLAYLGIRGVGYNEVGTPATRQFNATAILAYWDIVKNYYANKQEHYAAVIHTGATIASTQTVTNVFVQTPDGNTTWTIQKRPNASSTYNMLPGMEITIGYNVTPPDPRQIYFYLNGYGAVSFLDLTGGIQYDSGSSIRGVYNSSRYGGTYIENWDYMTNDMAQTKEPRVTLFELENIDTARELILAYRSESVPFILNDELGEDLGPYSYLWQTPNGFPNMLASQEGLAVKTYQSDIFNNWLDTTYIETINTRSSISTAGDSFTIDQFIIAEKLFYLQNRVAVSGGTYFDWVDTVYAEKSTRTAETPIYCGGLSKELVFQQVISNSESETQPLGTLAGRGKLSDKHKGGKVIIKTKEPSYIIGLFSLTPRIDYSQGNEWDIHLQTLDDLHKPQFDEIGFQNLITERMAYWDTTWNGTQWTQKVAGKQPAWIEYSTAVNKTFGNFAIANNQMFMTLNRRYEPAYGGGTVEIKDLTTYIDPAKYNFIFAQTSLDAMNFWVQIGCGITARRKMSVAIMPHL